MLKLLKNLFNNNNLPKINLLVGVSAFCFQIIVLNPWHSELSKQFNQLHYEIKTNNK